VLPLLLAREQEGGARHSNMRLLKLLCEKLFHPPMYSRKKRIGRGRFGNVYESTVQGSVEPVAVKVLDMPLSIHDPCTLFDLYTEVAILETLK
jgi:serine/threonine protein kinase